ncbi:MULTISPECIES: RNA polymerase factor sigma-70 [unclassified Halomonas]|uniref:RNA polymerase factor sigma-70 n=1 Tax=unclassified Halomonas TaxID=2609666 RepID=UPI0009903CFA|nr:MULTISPECIES: RNA polymerase factor sigma-70 [unclassified Halomonas]AVU08507.1 RNA polymerase factor sigma-70 [Halomonas sp. 'Soap Lake \
MDSQTWNAELEDIFVNQRQRLCCVAARVLGSADQADDVVQDAYLKISETQTLFVIKQPIAYASRVVRNLAIDRCRRSAFESTLFAQEEEGVNAALNTHSPETIAIDRQALGRVVDALDELPERTRYAFELYRAGGHTQREVAQQLGISTTLVNFMIRDALTHCRQSLQSQTLPDQ